LNRTFLGHDYATDVLSFPYGLSGLNLGELIVSLERAEAQAAEFGHTRMDEIRILMLHGLLHLTGMDHEKDGGEMAQAEDKWREDLGLPLALIARAQGVRGPSCVRIGSEA
jgi:probable rRNA maturation factor